MFDIELFRHVATQLHTTPREGLNGHRKEFCAELEKIGRNRHEFRKSFPKHERSVIARAVRQGFEFENLPNDEQTLHRVRQLIKHADEVGYDRLWRDRLLGFTSYISAQSS